jgi:hypothetical protein
MKYLDKVDDLPYNIRKKLNLTYAAEIGAERYNYERNWGYP